MTALNELAHLTGKWEGQNKLWLNPTEPARESHTTAEIRTIAKGTFSEIIYTWAENDVPQEGRITLGCAPDDDALTAVWLDTWHMQHQFMVCTGNLAPESAIRLDGTYPAPPGPDWGWAIVIEPGTADRFRLLMYNITPDGDEHLAVEAQYTRTKEK
jgi:hypothetical protein